jgi:hypothetical protein
MTWAAASAIALLLFLGVVLKAYFAKLNLINDHQQISPASLKAFRVPLREVFRKAVNFAKK